MDYIPIIDMENIKTIPINSTSDAEWIITAQKIREGLGGIGFIYLKNHGIDISVVRKAFLDAKNFFDLPQETKLKYKMRSTEKNNYNEGGYLELGQQLLDPTALQEFRESFDFCGGSIKYLNSGTSDILELNMTIYELRKQCNLLVKKLLILLAMSLELDDSQYFLNNFAYLDNIMLPHRATIKALHYPSIPKEYNISPGTVRLGKHSDFGMLTLLFQDMIGGLEVQNVDGKWVSATPIADTIIVNTGDLLELWSGRVFPATKHRVMIPEDEVLKRVERYSIAYFLEPLPDTVISSLKVKMTESEERRVAAQSSTINVEMKPVIAIEHILNKLKSSYK